MAFGHEKLDAYRAAIEHVPWAYWYCERVGARALLNRDALLQRVVEGR